MHEISNQEEREIFKYVETKQYSSEQPMGQKRNQMRNKKLSWN